MDEPGCEQVQQLPTPLVISALARVEVAAAIWRKHRMGELEHDDTQLLLRAFAADYAGTRDRPACFLAITVSGETIERATELAGIHGLRAYDAVQLACALAARAADESCATLASFDDELTAAGAAEGFAIAA